MTRIVVTGYASLDYPVRLDGKAEADRTTRIVGRSPDALAAPRRQSRLCRAGPGAPGRARRRPGDLGRETTATASSTARNCARPGIPLDGVERGHGRTPICILAYQPDGGCVCLFDAGLDGEPSLSEAQAALVAAADWVCLTVGPPT